MSDLQSLFHQLRALDWCHRAAHWQARGTTAFQEHLLFERLYGNTVEEIDAFAEKLVGTFGVDAVDPVVCVNGMLGFVQMAAQADDAPIPTALDCEERFLRSVAEVLESEDLSVGMENFLQGLADKHESHTYLLKQHLMAVPLETQWGPTAFDGEEPPMVVLDQDASGSEIDDVIQGLTALQMSR